MSEVANYLHGYHADEQERLYRQAEFLEPVIYEWIDLSGTRDLLEVGCGVGAQSEILLRRYPKLRLTGVDLVAAQIERAHQHFAGLPEFRDRCSFQRMDATRLEFADGERFDTAFFCWMLEHTPEPLRVLEEARRVLRPGGQVIITEVMNHTLFVSPPAPTLGAYWDQFNRLQSRMGGDPQIGARLGTLLDRAGFRNIVTRPRPFYYDRRTPEQRAAMFEYWSDLIHSGEENLLQAGSITREQVEALKLEFAALQSDPDAIFFYTFVQARAEA